MNKLKLSLENFQSIKNGILEFEQGLNFIIGQSNSGKSATFRALKACLANPIGSQRFIKRGYNKSSVLLKYNGNEIEWVRTPKESKYSINGEDFIKTGKSDAFKLIKDTGFVKGASDVIMNIEEELQLPFPFGLSGAELFKLFENVFCVSDSAVILKAAKDHESGVKLEISTLDNEVARNKLKLDELEKFKKEIDLEYLKGKKEFLSSKSKRRAFLLDGLPSIKLAVTLETSNIEAPIAELKNLWDDYKDKLEAKRALSSVKSSHQVEKAMKNLKAPVVKAYNDYKSAVETKKEISRLEQLGEVEAPIKAFSNKLGSFNELTSLKTELESLKSIATIKLPEKEFTSRLNELEDLKRYKNEVADIFSKIKEKKELMGKANERIKEIESKLSEFKVCPLCKREM